jgi:hypothetical protein
MRANHCLLLLCSILLACEGRHNASAAAEQAPSPAPAERRPPAKSPLARGVHPRLFVTAEKLPALRDRIAADYRREFQAFVDTVADPSRLGRKVREIESFWGSLNAAFIALLDPREMKRRGFDIDDKLDTAAEACTVAMGYANKHLGEIATGRDMGHSEMVTAYPRMVYVPVVAAYDWCYPHLDDAARRAVVDAFVSGYGHTWKGRDALTARGVGGMVGNNQASADIHDSLGILAFYGDPYPDREVQNQLYETFHTIWFDRALLEINTFYKTATNWHESSTNYFNQSFVNLGIPFAMFSSALGTDYIATTPFFTGYPIWAMANVKPHSLSPGCGGRCPDYLERWGTVGGGIGGVGCKTALFNTGSLAAAGHPNASLTRWLVEHVVADRCEITVTEEGGPWANGVLLWFLYGDRSVAPKSPAELGVAPSQALGHGQHVLRTGYEDPADTQLVFWAPEYNLYGHATKEVGSFTIHKFGNLLLKPANSKSGDAKIKSSKFNLFTNTVGIHKGGADPGLNFDGSVLDPLFKGRGTNSVRHAGRLLARALNGPGYDYIAYDGALSWKPATADLYQREFVYLRGPLDKEFVVVLDRVRVADVAKQKKIWKVWVPVPPRFVGADPAQPRPGKWTSDVADTIAVVNQSAGYSSRRYRIAPTHGALFLKVLSPSPARLSALGGPGFEFQSGDDDGATPWGSPAMTDAMRDYLGWGRIEVSPRAAERQDTFLVAMQFGDAASLTSMSPVVAVAGADGRLVGAHIADPANPWVVLFARDTGGPGAAEAAGSYSVASGAGATRHLLVDLAPGRTYRVGVRAAASRTVVTVSQAAAAGTVAATSTDQGVLTFTVKDGVVKP